MCSILMPVRSLSNSPVRCVEDPAPDEVKFSLPGLALAHATSSAILLTGSDAVTTTTLVTAPTSVTGAKSLIGSYGRFGYRNGWMVIEPTLPNSSVYPSGGDLATYSEPMIAEAPARFSTTT